MLVIGGTRFVGRSLVQRLASAGHEVATFNRGRENSTAESGVERLVGDRTDHGLTRGLLSGRKFEAVFDLSYAPTTAGDVDCTYAAVGESSHYVFCSSTQVYSSQGRSGALNESFPRDGSAGTYEKNKFQSEELLMRKSRRGGRVTILRPTFVYGPRNPYYREAFFFDRIEQGRRIICPMPTKVLQFVFVEDLAEAMVSAIKSEKVLGNAYNIAANESVRQDELIGVMAKVAQRDAEVVKVDRGLIRKLGSEGMYYGAALDPESDCVFDVAAAKYDLGFTAKTRLGDGLRDSYRWWVSNKDEFAKYRDFAYEDEVIRRGSVNSSVD